MLARKYAAVFLLLLIAFIISGCSSLTLKPAEFGWAIEDVVMVDSNGMIEVERYMIKVSVANLYFEETGDSASIAGNQLRIIRDNAGYYYMTAAGFRNVYVFCADDGTLSLVEKISIYENEVLNEPVFNQRPPYIELLDSGKLPKKLTKDGIAKEE